MLHLLTGIIFTAASATPPIASTPHSVTPVLTTPACADSAPILLTEDLLKSYEAVRADLMAFWPKHKALEDSARATLTPTMATFSGPKLKTLRDTVAEFNYVDLTAREPAVAAIFTAHKFAPAQYTPVTVALWQALYVVQLGENKHINFPIDSTSVEGKNKALAKAHFADFSALKIVWHYQQNGGGGGGDNNLNP